MIIVDRDRCKGDGLCATICHEHCITLVDDIPAVNHEFCSTCTQCVAACPQQALSWHGVRPIAFDRARLPLPEQLDELLKERRSIRFFKQDKLDRALVERIVGYGIYAPTNNFRLRAIIVDDEAIVEELDRVTVQYSLRIYNLFYRLKIISSLARMIGLSREYLQAKPKLETVLARGRVFHSLPAAMVFVVGDKRVPLSEVSAQCALCNMMLYAQASGVGSCLWGQGQMFYDGSRTVRKRLGLHKRENILGALLLGYPAIKFANKVEGKTLPIQWNSG